MRGRAGILAFWRHAWGGKRYYMRNDHGFKFLISGKDGQLPFSVFPSTLFPSSKSKPAGNLLFGLSLESNHVHQIHSFLPPFFAS